MRSAAARRTSRHRRESIGQQSNAPLGDRQPGSSFSGQPQPCCHESNSISLRWPSARYQLRWAGAVVPCRCNVRGSHSLTVGFVGFERRGEERRLWSRPWPDSSKATDPAVSISNDFRGPSFQPTDIPNIDRRYIACACMNRSLAQLLQPHSRNRSWAAVAYGLPKSKFDPPASDQQKPSRLTRSPAV
jgi:hypothetical protein